MSAVTVSNQMLTTQHTSEAFYTKEPRGTDITRIVKRAAAMNNQSLLTLMRRRGRSHTGPGVTAHSAPSFTCSASSSARCDQN